MDGEEVDGIPLAFSDELASAVEGLLLELGEEVDLNGARFGVATTTASPVPLPAAGWMLIAGLGGLGLMRRRKRAA